MKEKFVAILKLEGLMFAMGAAVMVGSFVADKAINWLFDDVGPKVVSKVKECKEKREAEKASKYATKTIESV